MNRSTEYIIRHNDMMLHAIVQNGVTMLKNPNMPVSRELIEDVCKAINLYENELTHRFMMSDFVIKEEIDSLGEN